MIILTKNLSTYAYQSPIVNKLLASKQGWHYLSAVLTRNKHKINEQAEKQARKETFL